MLRFLFALVSLGTVFAVPPSVVAAAAEPSVPCGLCVVAGTNDALLAVPLESTEVLLDAKPGLVEAQVTQTFTNRGAYALEATYFYPLPAGATLTDFELRFRDRVVRSVVKERAAAKETYEAAKAEGKKTALLEQRDPSLFSTAIANFLPGETVHVVLRFIQPLDLTLEAAEIRFPMVTGDKYFPAVPTPADPGVGSAPNLPRRAIGDRVTAQHFYAFDVQVAGLPVASIVSETHRLAVEARGDDRFAVRLAEEIAVPDRDFVLRVATRQTAAVRPTLVTQRTATGDYGLLTVFPPVTRARSTQADVPRDVLFLVDCSGSMSGARIESARRGVDGCLAMLRPHDRFQIVPFGTDFRFYAPDWVPASADELRKAREYARKMELLGGTEMQKALAPSLDFFGADERQHLLVFLTDGDVGAEDSLLRLIGERIARTRLFAFGIGSAPNAGLIRRMAELGRGQARFIADDRAIDRELTDLFATLDAPVLADLGVTLLDAAGRPLAAEFLPAKFGDVFLGRPLQVAFRSAGGAVAAVRLAAKEDDRPVAYTLAVQGEPVRGDGLEKQFGRRWFEELAMRRRASTSRDEGERLDREMLAVALRHGLVTEFTSRVAVEQRVSRNPRAPLASTTVAQEMPADQATALAEDIVVLSPFEVSADVDNGYATSSSLAGTRLRTQLHDCRSAVTVVTPEFLRDVGRARTEDLLAFVVEPAGVPGLLRGVGDEANLDGLPITTLVGRAMIERLEFSTKAFDPTAIQLRGAAGKPGGRTRVTAGDGGALFADAWMRWEPATWTDGRVLTEFEWSKFEHAQTAARVALAGGASSAARWDASAQWRNLGGYGAAGWVRFGVQRELPHGFYLAAQAAAHELRRDDPRQFARSAPAARTEGLGLFGLDLLTASTRRLSDRIAAVDVVWREPRRADGASYALQTRWHRRGSDWATAFATPRRRDETDWALVAHQPLAGRRLHLNARAGGTSFHGDAGAGGRTVSRGAFEAVGAIVDELRVFAVHEHDESRPWLASGWARTTAAGVAALALPAERREATRAGVLFRSSDGRIGGEVGWFNERRADESFRDWSWERDHAAGGTVTRSDGTVREAFSYGVWPRGRRTGWSGSLNFNPTPDFTAVLAWYHAWRSVGPYDGGARRGSLVVRQTWRLGGGREFLLGGGAAYRDGLVFDDGVALPGGTKLDAFVAYRWRHGGGATELRVSAENLADRPWPQTRFSPDRGRQFLVGVTREF